MKGLLNRHRFSYPSNIDHSEPRLGWRDFDTELREQGGTLDELLARNRQAFNVSPHVAFGYDEAMRRAEHLRQAEAMARMQAGEIAYDHGGVGGETLASPVVDRAQVVLDRDHRRRERIKATPDYQRKGRAGLQGYLNNPLDEQGREAIGTQFMESPLGGHVRSRLDGAELFGHTVTPEQAHRTEQVLAAALATGIGVPTFIAGVQGLLGPDQQSSGTMPL